MRELHRSNLKGILRNPRALLTVAIALLVLVTWQFHRNRLAVAESDRWESHSYEVLLQLDGLLSHVQDAETGQRGFLLTGKEDYLQPYNQALEKIQQRLARLRRLTQDNLHQQERLREMDSLIGAKLTELKQTIDLRRTQGFEAAVRVVQTGRGQSLMDQIRERVARVRAEETGLLEHRTLLKQAYTRRAAELATLEVLLCGVLLVTAFLLLERQKAASHASEVRYRRLFEAAQDGVLLLDPRSRKIRDANPFMSRLLGCCGEDLLGKELWEIGLLDDPEGNRVAFEQLARDGYIRYEDLPLRAHNGETREVEFVSNFYEEEGRSVIQCNIRDITQRRRLEAERGEFLVREQAARHNAEARAQQLEELNQRLRANEEQLRAANRELDDFATIVSHDLKAPLRGVSTLAKWLQNDYAHKLDEEGLENLADMVKRVGRMDRMIDGILQYSRLGRMEEKPEPVALEEMVPSIVEDLAPPSHVRVHVAPGLPLIYGEPTRLRQVFQNLIGNGIKFGNKSPLDIRIDWADVGWAWEFGVADNGPGIEARHFERIFKIFQTLAPKDRTDSTGVGLALVRRIVEQAGGRVWVESHVGVGSTFRFTWPKGPRAKAAELPERMAA